MTFYLSACHATTVLSRMKFSNPFWGRSSAPQVYPNHTSTRQWARGQDDTASMPPHAPIQPAHHAEAEALHLEDADSKAPVAPRSSAFGRPALGVVDI